MKFSRFPFSRILFRDPVLSFPDLLQQNDPAGGGGTPPVVNPNPVVTPQPDISAVVKATVASVLASQKVSGDAEAGMEVLARKAHAQEQRAIAAEVARDAAAKNSISDVDKADLAAYRALALKPDELKTQIEEGRAAKTQNAETRRLGELDKAARDLGLKPGLLKRLAPAREVISKEVDVKGEDGKFTKETRWFFKDGDKETEIEKEFDEEDLALLRADESANEPIRERATGRAYIAQGGGTRKTENSAQSEADKRIEAARKARTEKKNPLMR